MLGQLMSSRQQWRDANKPNHSQMLAQSLLAILEHTYDVTKKNTNALCGMVLKLQ